jgi:hypothetical protein
MIVFRYEIAFEVAQALKWASFISSFQDYFRKITSFLGCFKCGVFGAKYRKWLERGRLFGKLLDDVIAAAEDDNVSEEEFQKIVAEARKVAAQVEE